MSLQLLHIVCYFIISDGDLVTVFDSQDLSFALQTSRVLKLQVFMNNQEIVKPKLSAEEFKKQLREIRNAVTWLLDTYEVTNEGSDNMPNNIRNKKIYFRFISLFLKYLIYFIFYFRTRNIECYYITRNTNR